MKNQKNKPCQWFDDKDDNGDPYCSYPEFEGPCLTNKGEACILGIGSVVRLVAK